jgi:hypothetical protein
VADSGGNQRIDLAAPPPSPIVTRPLKTGKEFTLVLPQPRFILKAWDKAIYDPGEEATLLLKGKHLGDKPYTLIVEYDDGSGWSEVDRVTANVSGGTEAKGTFKIPAVKKLTGGKFTKAEWGAKECKPGETLQMHVEAEGLEGEWLVVVVEREESPGKWEPETRWDGHINGGKFDTSWQTPPLESDGDARPEGAITDVQFAKGPQLKPGDMAWGVCKASGMDGDTLRFELERELGPGKWETVGQAVSTIKAGEARAGVPIPLPKKADPVPTIQTARFKGKVVPGEEATAAVTTKEMDGQKITLALDMEVNGKWVEVDISEATVASNKASAQLKVPALEVLSTPDAPKEQLVSAKFSGEFEIGKEVTLDIVTQGMDGQTVTVILETAEGGEWIPLAETIAHVKGDAASAKVAVPSPIRLLEQFVQARFEKDRYRDGEDLTLLIDSVGVDGELADLSIEEEQLDGTFREIATDRTLLKQGQVKVKLTSAALEGKAGTGPPAPKAQGK